MRKLLAFQILVLLLVVGSCSESKSNHLIFGKWQCVTDKDVFFSFDQANVLRVEIKRPVKIYEHNLKYEIIDEKSVSFYHFQDGKITFEAILKNKNEFALDCQFNSQVNGLTRVDPPEFCAYQSFKRVE